MSPFSKRWRTLYSWSPISSRLPGCFEGPLRAERVEDAEPGHRCGAGERLEECASTGHRRRDSTPPAGGGHTSQSGAGSYRSNRVAVPWNTVLGLVWNIHNVPPSGAATMSKLGPLVKTSVPLQLASSV